jgi:hypothetical protein
MPSERPGSLYVLTVNTGFPYKGRPGSLKIPNGGDEPALITSQVPT